MLDCMTMKYPHLSSRAFVRAACIVGVAGLVTLGTVTSASAATVHFNSIGSPTTVEKSPIGIAFDNNFNVLNNTNVVWVANRDSSSVSLLSSSTGALIKS